MLDSVLWTKVLAINVKENIFEPLNAVKTSGNHHQILSSGAVEDRAGLQLWWPIKTRSVQARPSCQVHTDHHFRPSFGSIFDQILDHSFDKMFEHVLAATTSSTRWPGAHRPPFWTK